MRDFQDESSSSSHPKKITIAHMKQPYRKAGISPPSDSSLRNWKTFVEGTGNPALEALQELAHSTDPKVDLKPFTLKYLVRQDFLSLKDSPKEQALRLQILARFSVHNKRSPTDRDHDEIAKRAKDVAQWVDDLEAIIPRQAWSQELKKHVENYAFKGPSSWERFLQSHFAQIDDEIKRLERNLPAHSPHLDDWVVKTVRSQQCGLVRTAIENDPTMRSLYGEYENKYEKAENDVNAKKLQVAQPISPAKPIDATEAKDDNSSDSEDDDGGSELVFFAVCNPPQTTGYYCPDCAVRHIGDCRNAEMADKDGREMQKTRRCLDCTKSSPPSAVRTLSSKRAADAVGAAETSGGECTSKGKGPAGNRKKRAKITRSVTTPTLPPEADSDVAIKLACRAKNARLHDQVFLSPKTTDAELQDVVQLAQPAKLVFISIAAEKTLLLHKSPGANNGLKSILSAIAQVSCLHAQGTVVLAIPTPHHIHLTPLNDALTNPDTALVVEDHGLFVEYVTRGGGRLAGEKMEHLRGGVARFMIAHNNNDARAGKFKCNTRVTLDDISGTAPSQSRTDTSLMKDVSFPGANTHFPDRVSRFFINRFTTQGDTVMTCSRDRDHVVECALSLGRKVEVFAADSDNLDAPAYRLPSIPRSGSAISRDRRLPPLTWYMLVRLTCRRPSPPTRHRNRLLGWSMTQSTMRAIRSYPDQALWSARTRKSRRVSGGF